MPTEQEIILAVESEVKSAQIRLLREHIKFLRDQIDTLKQANSDLIAVCDMTRKNNNNLRAGRHPCFQDRN